jgi:hypothetical protein
LKGEGHQQRGQSGGAPVAPGGPPQPVNRQRHRRVERLPEPQHALFGRRLGGRAEERRQQVKAVVIGEFDRKIRLKTGRDAAVLKE